MVSLLSKIKVNSSNISIDVSNYPIVTEKMGNFTQFYVRYCIICPLTHPVNATIPKSGYLFNLFGVFGG
jgi:hypothetical protein